MEAFMKYLGIAAFLIFVFLVVSNASAASGVIKSLSNANINSILALQGRGGGQFVNT